MVNISNFPKNLDVLSKIFNSLLFFKIVWSGCLAILSILFFTLNLNFVFLLSDIPYVMIKSFSAHLFTL